MRIAAKQTVKKCLHFVAPRFAASLMSARARAHSQNVVARWGCPALNEKLTRHLGTRVREGQFAGLELSAMARREHLGPFLLGVYESELDECWSIIFRNDYKQIVDVGASFGYYAVGLAKRYPASPVIAFDTDWWARRVLREMAQINGVQNLEVASHCDARWFEDRLLPEALIVSDCEGYEAVLFPRISADAICTATLLIETHDSIVPSATRQLAEHFESTHDITHVRAREQRRQSTCDLRFLSVDERRLAENEVRDENAWLLCLPRAVHRR